MIKDYIKKTREAKKKIIYPLLAVLAGSILLLTGLAAYTLWEAANSDSVEEIPLAGWVEENGKTYYYDEITGKKRTGWLIDQGRRYYLDPVTKERVTGLVRISQKELCLFNPEGQLYENCTVGKYVINEYGIVEDIILSSQELRLRYERLDTAIEELAAAYEADGVSVALIEKGEVTDTFQYGYAIEKYVSAEGDIAISVPMTEDSKIRIASISKVILAMNGFKMMDEGTVDIYESIGKYWDFSIANPHYPDHTISLASIFTHTSSIADLNSYENIVEHLEENIIFNNIEPNAPSSSYYCNYAFAVAAATLEKADGKILDDLADDNFFTDLGIDAAFATSRLENPDLLAELRYSDESIAYSLYDLHTTTGTDVPGENGRFAVGGLSISAKDLARLICILANDGLYENKQYLSPEAVRLMETPFCKTDYHGVKVTQCMPLKYNTSIYGENRLYFHSGSAYGVHSLISYNPDTRNGVVVITTGALGLLDEYGIYAVCGDISSSIYTTLREGYLPEDLPQTNPLTYKKLLLK